MSNGRVQWLLPSMCTPPHRVTHPEKYDELLLSFKTTGWDESKPALLGYHWENTIQLITGSHRWYAAEEAKILIPVRVYSYEFIYSIWGTHEWVRLVKAHSS